MRASAWLAGDSINEREVYQATSYDNWLSAVFRRALDSNFIF